YTWDYIDGEDEAKSNSVGFLEQLMSNDHLENYDNEEMNLIEATTVYQSTPKRQSTKQDYDIEKDIPELQSISSILKHNSDESPKSMNAQNKEIQDYEESDELEILQLGLGGLDPHSIVLVETRGFPHGAIKSPDTTDETNSTRILCTDIDNDDLGVNLLNSSSSSTQSNIDSLEQSMVKSCIVTESETTPNDVPVGVCKENVPSQFGLHKYFPPTLICTHPSPYVGKDDDKNKLAQISNDILTKLGRQNHNGHPKILFGADNKVNANMLDLIHDPVNCDFEIFLPEVPCLHLRKSMINTTLNAYQNAGLIQILRYMKEDDKCDWRKLLGGEQIDMGTKVTKRIADSLHIASMISFMEYLPPDEAHNLFQDLTKNEGPKMPLFGTQDIRSS
ncbi:unnamed protein product, partial [Owenia fusiformis]